MSRNMIRREAAVSGTVTYLSTDSAEAHAMADGQAEQLAQDPISIEHLPVFLWLVQALQKRIAGSTEGDEIFLACNSS